MLFNAALGVVVALPLLSRAQAPVSGVSRLNLNDAEVKFSLDAYQSTITSIVSSVKQGPNRTVSESLPVPKLYGVNIGNWLVSEPWMSPTEWLKMGGQFCAGGDCSICRQSEWSLSTYLGQEATNQVFKGHWESWLTQADVNGMVAAGLNAIRIPLPFWIIEDIVDRSHEPYAQGGLDELIRGLTMFRDAGIHVILDHHALPGVAANKQMFAGNCTTQVEFYASPDDYNYKRAVTWSIVMAYLSHTHPAFETVFTIEAVNEPIQDATKTPGLDRFEKAFVLGVRALEATLGIICDDSFSWGILSDPIALSAFESAIPIISKLSSKYNIGSQDNFDWNSLLSTSGEIGTGYLAFSMGKGERQWHCLSTQFMNRDWQYNNPSNPADAAHGPQIYDNHLYLNFGGVAPNATEESYMQTLCNTSRVADAAAIGNAPLYFGEWSLATAFNTTTSFLKKYGDAQKFIYSQGAGWVFWNWKIDMDGQTYPILGQYIQWSYRDALNAGIFTPNPADLFDQNVCAPYLNATSSN